MVGWFKHTALFFQESICHNFAIITYDHYPVIFEAYVARHIGRLVDCIVDLSVFFCCFAKQRMLLSISHLVFHVLSKSMCCGILNMCFPVHLLVHLCLHVAYGDAVLEYISTCFVQVGANPMASLSLLTRMYYGCGGL